MRRGLAGGESAFSRLGGAQQDCTSGVVAWTPLPLGVGEPGLCAPLHATTPGGRAGAWTNGPSEAPPSQQGRGDSAWCAGDP